MDNQAKSIEKRKHYWQFLSLGIIILLALVAVSSVPGKALDNGAASAQATTLSASSSNADAAAAIVNVKLNEPLVAGGDVSNMWISPDDQWVVYIADQDTNDVFEVYSTRLDGSITPIRLSRSFVNGGFVTGLAISPDSAWVVYRADQDTDQVFELYSVPIDGGNPTKLNGTFVAGGDVVSGANVCYALSPDSQWVVYRADQETDNVNELFSVPIDGSDSPVKLNGSLVSGGSVSEFSIAHISSSNIRVVYRAVQDVNGVSELYSVPIAGGSSPGRLSGQMVAGGNVNKFLLSPDGQWVVYLADQETDNVRELFSVPTDDSLSPSKLNGTVNENVDYYPAISPNNSLVVYSANQDLAPDFELYSVPIGGNGSPEKLASIPLIYSYSPLTGIVVSPDSNWVVYQVDTNDENNREIFSVPIDGSLSPVKTNAPLVPYQWIYNLLINANSSRVVYYYATETSGGSPLYSVPINGSETATKLYSPLVDWGYMWRASLTEDGNRVVFLTDQDAYIKELYTVPINGNFDPIILNGNLVSGGEVNSFRISKNANHVIYLADQDTDNVFELYASKLPQFGLTYLPAIMNNYCSKFAGPMEMEPNDLSSQANGCLISGFVYSGNPDAHGAGQDSDYYYINVPVAGMITIDVTNFITDGQVQLYYQTVNDPNPIIVRDQPSGNYHITHNGGPGLYYIRVVSPADHATGNGNYSLEVNFP